jgi:hypothetical protein
MAKTYPGASFPDANEADAAQDFPLGTVYELTVNLEDSDSLPSLPEESDWLRPESGDASDLDGKTLWHCDPKLGHEVAVGEPDLAGDAGFQRAISQVKEGAGDQGLADQADTKLGRYCLTNVLQSLRASEPQADARAALFPGLSADQISKLMEICGDDLQQASSSLEALKNVELAGQYLESGLFSNLEDIGTLVSGAVPVDRARYAITELGVSPEQAAKFYSSHISASAARRLLALPGASVEGLLSVDSSYTASCILNLGEEDLGLTFNQARQLAGLPTEETISMLKMGLSVDEVTRAGEAQINLKTLEELLEMFDGNKRKALRFASKRGGEAVERSLDFHQNFDLSRKEAEELGEGQFSATDASALIAMSGEDLGSITAWLDQRGVGLLPLMRSYEEGDLKMTLEQAAQFAELEVTAAATRAFIEFCGGDVEAALVWAARTDLGYRNLIAGYHNAGIVLTIAQASTLVGMGVEGSYAQSLLQQTGGDAEQAVELVKEERAANRRRIEREWRERMESRWTSPRDDYYHG